MDSVIVRWAARAAASLMVAQGAFAAGPYVSLGVGFAGGEPNADVSGVNHPTRCDRLLYADPASAPTDAACTDATARSLFNGALDVGGAVVGFAGIGYAWERVRMEAEFSHRAHDTVSVPAIATADNPALAGKASEWSDHAPPSYQISGLRLQELFANIYYTFDDVGSWTPFVGAGVGFAHMRAGFRGEYLRRTVGEGYVVAAGGDPAQPEEWQLAAAGSISALVVDVDERLLGYQLFAGLERDLAERTSASVRLRWARFDSASSDDVWQTVRSHAPVQADGVTPFRTTQTFDDLGSLAASLSLRYAF